MHSWEQVTTVAERIIDAGERVVIIQRRAGAAARGLEIGEMHAESARSATCAAARLRKIVLYYDRENALADLGLEE